MSTLDILTGALGPQTARQLSQVLGADESKTRDAMAAIVPVLLGALSRNAAQPGGAQSLLQALQKDHDGTVLDNVGAFLGGADSGPGDGILRHVLGSRRGTVEAGLSRTTGLDAAKIAQLMKVAAPLVLGALGRAQRQGNLDAKGLAGLLATDRQKIEREAPEQLGLLGKLLDADGDGDVDLNDIAKRGLGGLGKLFGGG